MPSNKNCSEVTDNYDEWIRRIIFDDELTPSGKINPNSLSCDESKCNELYYKGISGVLRSKTNDFFADAKMVVESINKRRFLKIRLGLAVEARIIKFIKIKVGEIRSSGYNVYYTPSKKDSSHADFVCSEPESDLIDLFDHHIDDD